MDPPPGFEDRIVTKVCRLKKAFYGLKQSPRAWFDKFIEFVMKQVYKQAQSGHKMFVKFSNSRKVYVLIVYVDDIVLVSGYY